MIQEQECDYEFKIIVIGNVGVGKSSLLLRFTENSFSDSYSTTFGVNQGFRAIPIEGKMVKLQILDTAGQEKYRAITTTHYRRADAIVMVYDVTDQASFEDVEKSWISDVKYLTYDHVELLLIGNKSDLDTRTVSTEQGSQYAQSNKMGFLEASAKTSDQVDAAFINLARIMKKKKDEQKTQ